MTAAVETIEFLARSAHRVRTLEVLADGPAERYRLRDETGASSPTIGRVLADFEERRWAVRDGSAYTLTPLGAFVADRFLDLCEAMETEHKLREVWPWLPRETSGFDVDLFADAVVSYPGPGYPYTPVERMEQLVESTGRMRGFGTIVLKAGTMETVCGAVLDGTAMEYVFAPHVLRAALDWDPARIAEVAACTHCRVFVHESLPDVDRCGIVLVDDRVGICCHDLETGGLQAVVDTGAPEAVEWAEAVFERYRDEATPVEGPGDLGDSLELSA